VVQLDFNLASRNGDIIVASDRDVLTERSCKPEFCSGLKISGLSPDDQRFPGI